MRRKTPTREGLDRAEKMAASLDGLHFVEQLAHGSIPLSPIAILLGMSVTTAGPGTVTLTCEPDESTHSRRGAVHGGLLCTLLDSAIALAAHTTYPADTPYASIDLTVHYLRPVQSSSGGLACHGKVTKPGRTLTFAEAEIIDSQGRLIATATGTVTRL